MDRSGNIQWAPYLEMRSIVIEKMELRRVKISSCQLVADECIVFPGIPKSLDHIDELARPFVAVHMWRMGLEAEVEGFIGT